jgi:hypothetical protein
VITGIALLVLIFSGISIFHTPRYEVIYNGYVMKVPFDSGKTGAMVVMDLGNTGRRDLEYVRVKLNNSAVDRAMMPLSAKSWGVREISMNAERGESVTTYDIGGVKSGDRVEIAGMLSYDAGQKIDSWADIYAGIAIPEGEAKEGDPASATYGRVLFSMFSSLWPF